MYKLLKKNSSKILILCDFVKTLEKLEWGPLRLQSYCTQEKKYCFDKFVCFRCYSEMLIICCTEIDMCHMCQYFQQNMTHFNDAANLCSKAK